MNLWFEFCIRQILDADSGPRLESSTGRIATRDIVQFVAMREVHSKYLSPPFFFFCLNTFILPLDGHGNFFLLGPLFAFKLIN